MWRNLLLIVAWGLAMAAIQANAGEWNDREMKQYYEAQVAWEIDHCLQKCHLMDSRSATLRAKARDEVRKAQFLKAYQEQLVEDMVQADIGMEHYKVQQYINHRYHDHGHGYATLNLRYCE